MNIGDKVVLRGTTLTYIVTGFLTRPNLSEWTEDWVELENMSGRRAYWRKSQLASSLR